LGSSEATNQTLTNLTVLISASTTSCTPPSVLVTDPSAAWNSDLNAGAGGKYVNLCATYNTEAVSGIVSVQAAGLTSKYKPNCDFSAGYTPLTGNLNEDSKNPGVVHLCVKRAPISKSINSTVTSPVLIHTISGAVFSTGCPKDFRPVTSAESPATAFNFDPAGAGVVLCVPAPPPPLPPAPPPGPRGAITQLRVLVVAASEGGNVTCPTGLELLRPLNSVTDWDLDFNSGAGGDYTYLCVGRDASASPILSLLGFHTPSAADPFENCPGNYTKVLGNTSEVGANDLNHGSLNVGAMYLCYRKDIGSPIYDLAGLPGGGNASSAAGCQAARGWEAIHGPPAYPGVFDFDPSGRGLILCADRKP